MMYKTIVGLSCCLLLLSNVWTQNISLKPVNDVEDKRMGRYCFVNANIHVNYDNLIEKGQLCLENGKVVAVGKQIKLLQNAIVYDLNGKYIYPSFIDLYSSYGIPQIEKKANHNWNAPEQIQSNTKGAYGVNQAIKAEYDAYQEFQPDTIMSQTLLKQGFGMVASFKNDGLMRGTGCLVSLTTESPQQALIDPYISSYLSFKKGSSTQTFPISIMGFVALIRQTLFDAQWYQINKTESNIDLTLEAVNKQKNFPKIFETNNWQDIFRANEIGKENGETWIMKTNGDEYQRINEIAALKIPLILPVKFADPLKISLQENVDEIPYSQLKHWEMSPFNPVFVKKAGIEFALTSYDLKEKNKFLEQIRTIYKNGLAFSDILKSLTFTPAKLLHKEKEYGNLEPGKWANFFISSQAILDEKSEVIENWIKGKRNVFYPANVPDYRGVYEFLANNQKHKLIIKDKLSDPTIEFYIDSVKQNFESNFISESNLTLQIYNKQNLERLIVQKIQDSLVGQLIYADNKKIVFSSKAIVNKKDSLTTRKNSIDSLENILYPFNAFGFAELPQQNSYLLKNATVWTNEKEGVLENTDVLFLNGKIHQIGKNLSSVGNNVQVIDVSGKYLTTGIIDEHSHIALSQVNDIATNSSLCNMKDAVNSEDINIYRNLSGGVVAAQLLHGSANPIGGQSAIIKLRWGQIPQKLLIQDADNFIKFALGENVKRSSNIFSIRFPQTRMGVEQFYVNAFSEAKQYMHEWENYKAGAISKKPRVNLSLEPLVEILNKKRFISCHSYVQSEINMLMKVADQFNFNVNTFTHILEGYKVADKMKKHKANASTFSDWWTYKMEVVDAIPYNAALMTEVGINTAINSDDAEMSRRLNQEAAKTIKYGHLNEEDAWKTVTLNPAKMLHLENKMGSIKVGKDADLVIWSDNPLSVYAKAEKTFVDGKLMFDRNSLVEKQNQIKIEKIKIIHKMLLHANKKDAKKPSNEMKLLECETITNY